MSGFTIFLLVCGIILSLKILREIEEEEKLELINSDNNKAKEEMQEQGLALQSDMDKTIEQNIQLKAQIEKMKCCSNCDHFNKESDIEYCQNCERHLVNSLDNFPREEIIKDEWELRRGDKRK